MELGGRLGASEKNASQEVTYKKRGKKTYLQVE